MEKDYSKLPRILLVLLAIVVVATMAACSTTSLQIVSQDLTARQFTSSANKTQSTAVVSGMARNSSSRAIHEVRITVDYFDEKNNRIGTATAYRESMEPEEIWNYTVQLTNADAWKARTFKISCSNK